MLTAQNGCLFGQPEECAKAQQLKGTVVMPLAKQKPQSATKQLTKKDKRFSAYNMLQRVSICVSCNFAAAFDDLEERPHNHQRRGKEISKLGWV